MFTTAMIICQGCVLTCRHTSIMRLPVFRELKYSASHQNHTTLPMNTRYNLEPGDEPIATEIKNWKMILVHRKHDDDFEGLPDLLNEMSAAVILVTGPVDFNKWEVLRGKLKPHVQWRLSKEDADVAIVKAKLHYSIELTEEEKEFVEKLNQEEDV